VYNLLGIDFEEWYHPELIQKNIDIKKKVPKVVKGIDKILEWLRKNEINATFFLVGEILEENPELIDKICQNEHEIAFHSMHHQRLDLQNEKIFSEELEEFQKLTEYKSIGFRAPTFSLNKSSSWLIDVLTNHNYQYDSSIVPAKTQLYGMLNAETKPYLISKNDLEKNSEGGKIIEFPLLTTDIFGKRIPAGGGFYLRALPIKFIENAIKCNISNNIPSTFYIHSWELTPEFMPKLQLPWKDKFITYYNLNKALPKMDKLVKKFEFTSFKKYISKFN
jgi:polysaccharide deacetylase family protein (PEP-CTERM system associated)